jgi:transcriptional regulator with XRE-family HTH domain
LNVSSALARDGQSVRFWTWGRSSGNKRVEIGISQQQVAIAAGIARLSYLRIERGGMSNLPIMTASRVAAVLGLDLAVRAYPGVGSMRGAADTARLARVMQCEAPPLSFANEVPLPQGPDLPFEQRAWDAMVSGRDKRTGFEMEMRIRDGQALERRIELKRRDDPVDGVVLLLADTKTNRDAINGNLGLFPGMTRLTFRELARLLRSGQHPPSSLVFVPGDKAR